MPESSVRLGLIGFGGPDTTAYGMLADLITTLRDRWVDTRAAASNPPR